MAMGTGLGAQFGLAAETTVGTAVAVTRFLEFDSESFARNKQIVQGQGLRAGKAYLRGARRAFTTRDVNGQVVMEVPSRGAGLLFKQMIGSTATPVQNGVTTAYTQTHVPSSNMQNGLSLTVQVGKPSANGTVNPFTYNGVKVTDWEIACAVGGIPMLTVNFDGWDETTSGAGAYALQAASYTLGNVYNFTQGTLYLGGTPSTASGIVSIAGGTAVAAITAASVKNTHSLKTDRYYFGSAGIKAEQLHNGYSSISGTLNAEFIDMSSVYNTFQTDAATALELKFVGGQIGTSGYFETLDIIIPQIRLEGGTPPVAGPDMLQINANFTGLDDGTNAPIQLQYISADTTL